MKAKERLDQLLVARQLFPSRESARTAIMDGGIIVNGEKLTKPGQAVSVEANIELISSYNRCAYVSRGGLKLEKALSTFAIATEGRICIDAGASTGGFTDCLLKAGAAFVYAIDVGYGQLDWSLRSDSRVHTLERTNIRFLTAEKLYGEKLHEKATLAVADLSFISVTKVLEALLNLMSENERELVILVKPQFEAGREKVGKGGVVREPASHVEVLQFVINFAQTQKLEVRGLTYSPLKGPSGNIEYLLWLQQQKAAVSALCSEKVDPETVVKEAFASL
ncbi:TlyA family RNA methyltransferase [bacterium]|jgi:23S rRNA (cytidine1920-2'-O)/16S rRNA (cytidine1409-2'-O)-methyltransferase|nr:TlyA family RNA methyltransferase [bacterium]